MTRIKILETSLSGTDEAVLSHQCELALMVRVPPGFVSTPVIQIAMVAVAHNAHPLAQLPSVTEAELKNHRQIVVSDSGLRREQNAGWLGSEQRWTVGHFATSVDTVEAGLGFAFLPEHRVLESLNSGLLKRLPLQMGGERRLPLNLVITQASHAGPATKALAQTLTAAFSSGAHSNRSQAATNAKL